MVDGNYLNCTVRFILEAYIGTLSSKAKLKLTKLSSRPVDLSLLILACRVPRIILNGRREPLDFHSD